MKLPTQERKNIFFSRLIRVSGTNFVSRGVEISHVAQKFVKNLKERERRKRKKEKKKGREIKGAKMQSDIFP